MSSPLHPLVLHQDIHSNYSSVAGALLFQDATGALEDIEIDIVLQATEIKVLFPVYALCLTRNVANTDTRV